MLTKKQLKKELEAQEQEIKQIKYLVKDIYKILK